MTNNQDNQEIQKVILQGTCLQAIQKTEDALKELRNNIMANSTINCSWEDHQDAHNKLNYVLGSWQEFKKGVIK